MITTKSKARQWEKLAEEALANAREWKAQALAAEAALAKVDRIERGAFGLPDNALKRCYAYAKVLKEIRAVLDAARRV